jgi:hypothetical protein
VGVVRHPFGIWTPLMEAALSAGSEINYRRGVILFVEWAQDEYEEELESFEDLDEALAEYAWHVFESKGGSARWRLENAIYGIEWLLPGCKGRLRFARLSNSGWRKLKPPTSHSPMTWPICVAVALEMQRVGHVGAAVGTLLAFDGYLRVNEMAALRSGDIVVLGDLVGEMGPKAGRRDLLVSLVHCKTGDNQSVIIHDEVVAKLVWRWVRYVDHETGWRRHRRRRYREKGPIIVEDLGCVGEWDGADPALLGRGPKLFPGSAQYRRIFYTACRDLGMRTPPLYFVPHSLRHGGATRDYLKGGGAALPGILHRGRWRQMDSARHYIQAGPALSAAAARAVDPARMSLWRAQALDVSTWFDGI